MSLGPDHFPRIGTARLALRDRDGSLWVCQTGPVATENAVPLASAEWNCHRDKALRASTPVAPTHWSFSQLAAQVGAPAAYLRNLSAALAGINLQYG